uniref:Acetyl-CoA carboxylase n=1 Tax=Eutreptiella gymnastica TaxID=73025 RepID=A0A7S1I8U2_9EUGL
MADECVEVPVGSNKNNYANVDLILDLAKRTKVDAVWVGWGHASENPLIPDALAEIEGITFLGPPASAMRALGDKISSTVVAQSAGVPCIKWSGSGITLPEGVVDVDEETYMRCCIKDLADCKQMAEKVGFPLMIKASEGGGGKGIRMVKSMEQIEDAYIQCCAEIPGSPIFLMTLATGCRHLEVQLLGDQEGGVISLKTRDCSVQRRHQKIIEEGPVLSVKDGALQHMEQSAVRLARLVGYQGVGTVEYLYEKATGNYYFLELNPRLQVEHPVTEMITEVNIPACMLMVGMGIPLHRMPDIRRLYGVDPTGVDRFNLDGQQVEAVCHTIAVRVTAENPDEGFRPTSGSIHTIDFKPSRTTWGYFSVAPPAGVHEFADSQFGHIFSSGPSREIARKGMVMALSQLRIKGEIRTTYEYVMNLLERPEFTNCDVSTAWLDGLLATNEQLSQPIPTVTVICGAIHKMSARLEKNNMEYLAFLQAGHAPRSDLLDMCFQEVLILNNIKYLVKGCKISSSCWDLELNGSHIRVETRILNDRGILVYLSGDSYVTSAQNDPNGLRVVVNGKTAQLSNDDDPCSLRTTVPGKLVRYLVNDGDFIESGHAYAEIEVMKMILQLKTNISGTVSIKGVAGTAVAAGKVLAQMTPLDASQIATPDEFTEPWPEFKHVPSYDSLGPESPTSSKSDVTSAKADMALAVQNAVKALRNICDGYQYPADVVECEISAALDVLQDAAKALNLLPILSPYIVDMPTDADNSPKDRLVFLLKHFLELFWQVEYPFDTVPEDIAVLGLCKDHAGDLPKVAAIMCAHRSNDKVTVVRHIISMVTNLKLSQDLKDTLEKISKLQNLRNNRVVLQSRQVLRYMNLAGFDEMKAQLKTLIVDGTAIRKILYMGKYTMRMIIALLKEEEETAVRKRIIELLVRRNYNTFDLNTIEIDENNTTSRARWSHRIHHSSHLSQSMGMPGSGTGNMSDMGAGDDGSTGMALANTEWGLMFIYRNVDDVLASFATDILNYMSTDKDLTSSPSVVEIMLTELEGGKLDPRLEELMTNNAEVLSTKTGCQRLTFRSGTRNFYTFRRVCQFKEDPVFRDVAPTLAWFMELSCLSNYTLEAYPLRGRGVRVYFGKEKPGIRQPPIPERDQDKCFFLRMLQVPTDTNAGFDINQGEELIAEAIQILEVAMADKRYKAMSNHLFISFIEQLVTVEAVENFVNACMQRYLSRFHELSLTHIELTWTTPDRKRVRMFIHNPLGQIPHVQTYYEETRSYKPVLVPAKGQGPVRPVVPHPLLSTVDRKRLAAQRLGTTYVYDWTETFEVAVKSLWKTVIDARNDVPDLAAARPEQVVRAQQLILDSNGTLVQQAASADVVQAGMVCWEYDLYLPTRYNPKTKAVSPKKVVVVANDITFESGSFAIEEDKVFNAACMLAKNKGLPLIYLACNSGARIGMAQEVKDVYKVMFMDPTKPEKGFEYLYLDEADYQRLSGQHSINAVPAKCPYTGVTHYRIKDVIGIQEGLGVENLSGSGLIAGQMSASYDAIPTLSLCSGRSVGIGAYLNRLSRRVVQVVGCPMLLTGAAALNTLLGKEVYTSNNQLGGTPVMSPNGVTHWEVTNDYKGIVCILKWLDMTPDRFPVGPKDWVPCQQPHFQTVLDPWDRDIEYMPQEGQITDPRLLITGTTVDGQFHRGLFDENSWHESLSKWATTVVAGRAKLGGLPVGVIAVETRTQEKILPADPADAASIATVRSQAGNVWFPDSARKTADCIQDFDKEGLPCFILANWRGFSGGQKDMFDEVLKFGASIVDNLRVYSQPIFVYLPPFGDLRGGAWVVVDYNINPECIEMYADETSHAGVLEPSGLVEVKYRDGEIVQTMHRIDDVCKSLVAQLKACAPEQKAELTKQLKARQEVLSPIYKSMAVQLASLHDTPGRMLAKGAIQGIVQWRSARRFFFQRLRRRLHELQMQKSLAKVDPGSTIQYRKGVIAHWCGGIKDDASFVQWCEDNAAAVEKKIWAVEQEFKIAELGNLFASGPQGGSVMVEVLRQYLANGGDKSEITKVLADFK